MRKPAFALLLFGLGAGLASSQSAYQPFALLRIIDGSGPEWAKAVAVDSQNNLYVAGLTASSDLPVTQGVLQPTFGGGSCFAGSTARRPCNDIFVAKYSPSGELKWLTYLGGDHDELLDGIAVHPTGALVVIGATGSENFPWTDPATAPSAGFLASIASDGTRLTWTQPLAAQSSAVAVDGAGAVWLAGTAETTRTIPVRNPLQAEQRFAFVYKRETTDGLWSAAFINRAVQAVAVHPSDPLTVYAAGPGAIYRSADAGDTFAAALIDSTKQVLSLAVDANVPERIYAGTTAGLLRSTDAGVSWTQMDSRLGYVVAVTTHRAARHLVYAGTRDGVYKSTDGGSTWSPTRLVRSTVPPEDETFIETLALDPTDASVVYAGTAGGLLRTSDGGNSWERIDLPPADERVTALAVDPNDPRTLYAGAQGTWISRDRGETWSRSSLGRLDGVRDFGITSDGVYAASRQGLFVSRNRGATWQVVGDVPEGSAIAAAGSHLYFVATPPPTDAYVSKFSAEGVLLFSSYFGGTGADSASSIAIDSFGNVLLGGSTASPDFPVLPGAAQRRKAGDADFFVAAFSPDGQRLLGSTYLGGTDLESGLRVASHPNGEVYLAGSTDSAELFSGSGFGPMGSTDTILVVLNRDLSTILRGTRVGGSSSEYVHALSVSLSRGAVIAGQSWSKDYPDDSRQCGTGSDQATITILGPGDAIGRSMCAGGGASDEFESLATTPGGGLVVAGWTDSNDFPGLDQPVRSMASFVAVLPAGDAGPTIAHAGIVNAASYRQQIAPGSAISIFGTRLATLEGASNGMPLPRQLNGVSVFVNGEAAPLFYAGASQINAQIPFETPFGKATLVVDVEGRKSAPVSFEVLQAGPGVFFTAETNHAIAQNFPDWSLNSAENAARPGQYVIVYLTGLGLVDNPVPAGEAPAAEPLSRSLAAAEAKVGGQPAEVTFAGLTPGFAALAQINIKIPDVPPGEQPLEITVGGVRANATVLSIKGN